MSYNPICLHLLAPFMWPNTSHTKTQHSSPDAMRLRKEGSSVSMDNIPITEMKKQESEMERDGAPLEKSDIDENGGDLGESGIADSPSVMAPKMERKPDLSDFKSGMVGDSLTESSVDLSRLKRRMVRTSVKMRLLTPQPPSVSSMPADFPIDAEMVTKMNPELYKAVKGGKIAYIQESAGDVERSRLDLLETTPKLNTILHVAASSGHDQLVQKILDIERCRKLVKATNSTGDLALHVAANAGHLSIVKLLVSQLKLEDSTVGQLGEKSKEGNTPLHLALINKYQKVALKTKYHELASFLVDTDPKVSCFRINQERKSPLYLAAEAGDAELVNLMIKKGNPENEMLPVDGKSIVHAAIYGAFTTKNRGNFPISLGQTPVFSKENVMIELIEPSTFGTNIYINFFFFRVTNSVKSY
jgi:ankyrin repeat protein